MDLEATPEQEGSPPVGRGERRRGRGARESGHIGLRVRNTEVFEGAVVVLSIKWRRYGPLVKQFRRDGLVLSATGCSESLAMLINDHHCQGLAAGNDL